MLRRETPRLYPGAMAVLPDENLVIESERLWMITSAPAQRVAAALTGLRMSAHNVRAAISTTAPHLCRL